MKHKRTEEAQDSKEFILPAVRMVGNQLKSLALNMAGRISLPVKDVVVLMVASDRHGARYDRGGKPESPD